MVLGFCVCGTASMSWATYSRVESMGKSADFFMDDISIFDNPANMNVFPNFLIGELGTYRQDTSAAAAAIKNQDPANSWFGGIFSYAFVKEKQPGKLYPQVSLGGAFNRKDEELFRLLPDSANGKLVPEPATNFDGFLGMALTNGGMLGSHVYVAVEEGADSRGADSKFGTVAAHDPGVNVYVLRGDLGVNWPIAKNVDGEFSFGLASIDYGPKKIDPEFSYFVRGRAYSHLNVINGELVPLFIYSVLQAPGQSYTKLHLGMGVNVPLDRGFFWLGVQGLFDEMDQTGIIRANGKISYYSDSSAIKAKETIRGGMISFGIERNFWFDWLVLRVGGQKEITHRAVEDQGQDYSYIYTNPTGDGTAGDHVGFGIGVNVEEKLKIDATLAENIPYTFGAFSGPTHHLISRISATYSF